ncbi:glutathione S-transferase family protein [Paracoccus saliphilus]|uniref:Glutathione S-transferase n=1 Tax=Paracoccus saliphilus TaxID=405559 RepID=A0AA45W1K7_9RHOB|nr:glutathione S-transferase family protein [Paracoccus saliphilus]WCR03677.1 glutathione S-transferase family protein [Paracoccus saliphilus]SIS57743.1 glutathione S-transferase [Paracoccus saliphilus]
MSLTLYYHPLASYCWKVLIPLYEAETSFTPRQVDLGDPEDRELMLRLSPVGKMPVLQDDARQQTIMESSIIIEWLDLHHPGAHPMLPTDPDAALTARLWDRFFDLNVQGQMQPIVNARLTGLNTEAETRIGENARAALDKAYAAADRHLLDQEWAGGTAFGLADCAAAPALFYAGVLHPFGPDHPNLSAYFERLIARQSVARVIGEAKPCFDLFPFRERIPERFL